MRAKLVCSTKTTFSGTDQEHLVFNAVAAKGYPSDGSDENNTFAKFSPSAELKMDICNPALAGKINPGDTFYVDFTIAPK